MMVKKTIVVSPENREDRFGEFKMEECSSMKLRPPGPKSFQ